MKQTTKAKDFIFSMLDMDSMFNENRRAFEEYQKKIDGANEKEKQQYIVVEEFQTLKQFYSAVLKRLATVSHGDIVLIDGDKEIKRYKAHYQNKI